MLQPQLTTSAILKLVILSKLLHKTRRDICKSSGSYEYFLASFCAYPIYMHTEIYISPQTYIQCMFSVCMCVLINKGSFLYPLTL